MRTSEFDDTLINDTRIDKSPTVLPFVVNLDPILSQSDIIAFNVRNQIEQNKPVRAQYEELSPS